MSMLEKVLIARLMAATAANDCPKSDSVRKVAFLIIYEHASVELTYMQYQTEHVWRAHFSMEMNNG